MAILPLQLARVSNLLRSGVAQGSITGAQARLLRVQNELSSGRRLNVPSDDPGDAAVVQQLQKTLEQRDAYQTNLNHAKGQLGEVDSTLGDLSDLVQQAQTIASANVGSDVTPDQRTGAAGIIGNLQSQMLSLANKEFEGTFLFAGDRGTRPPFESAAGGTMFVGSTRVLLNTYDENTVLPFMVSGGDVFGALSSRVTGTADLTPAVSAQTRLDDLRGATGAGVPRGSILIGNGTTTATVNLAQTDTVGDVINAINAAALGNITASIAPDGNSLQLTTTGADNITVQEVGGNTTAQGLGILTVNGGGAGAAVDGGAVGARVTGLTPLSALRNGAGVDTAGLKITNGQSSATIDLSAATTVEDLINAINGSGTSVRAEIAPSGTGINIFNPIQGTQMSIGENGGTTATDLGVRSFRVDTPLSELNNGKGVRTTANGADFEVRAANGVSFTVDVSGLGTVQDVINAINTAATGAGVAVAAGFATTGNGITLTDTTGGGGPTTVTSMNFSEAATDLGLGAATSSGGVLSGTDVNPVAAGGMFASLQKLRDGLHTNNQEMITEAAEGLQSDFDRVARIRGQTGARVQELESRDERLQDENVATKSLLSSLEDTDMTDAITRFQTLQNALQATMQTSARTLNLSLLDFLG